VTALPWVRCSYVALEWHGWQLSLGCHDVQIGSREGDRRQQRLRRRQRRQKGFVILGVVLALLFAWLLIPPGPVERPWPT